MMTEYQQKIEGFDLIYLDSFHNANYVKKIFYYYYKMLKKDGVFYFDDNSNISYLKNFLRKLIYR